MPLTPSRAKECEGRHGNRGLKSKIVQKSLCPHPLTMSASEVQLPALVWGFFLAEGAVREHRCNATVSAPPGGGGRPLELSSSATV